MSTSSDREPNPNQLSASSLPPVTRVITSHDPETSKAIIHSSTPFPWVPYDTGNTAWSSIYKLQSLPVSLEGDEDVKVVEGLPERVPLISKGESMFRAVDFAPGYACAMHRTTSLDYGIVMEGTIEMELDSGEKKVLQRGDVVVQRATMHLWRNLDPKEWARMFFVLFDAEVGRGGLREELGEVLKS